MDPELKRLFKEAVLEAISEMGIEQFKKTSFFGTSHRKEKLTKAAA